MSKKTENLFFKEKKFRNENEHNLPDHVVEDIRDTPELKNKKKKLNDALKKDGEDFVNIMEDDDKASKYVEDTEREKLVRSYQQGEEAKSILDGMTQSSYRANIAEYGMWILVNKYFPKHYQYHCVPTKKGDLNIYGKNFDTKEGLIFVLKDMTTGNVYIKAMLCVYDPDIDIKGVHLMAVEVENTVDALEAKREPIKKPTGILDANGEEYAKSK